MKNLSAAFLALSLTFICGHVLAAGHAGAPDAMKKDEMKK